jgi:hypothetical protein
MFYQVHVNVCLVMVLINGIRCKGQTMPVVTTITPNIEDPNKQPKAVAPGAPQPVNEQTTIPYAQPNQLTPVIKPSQPANNDTVLQTAQQLAVDAQNKPNETMGLVQSAVQKTLTNPLGYDKNAYINNQLEQFDRNRSNAMSSFQQSNADTSNTGMNLEKAYNYAMEGAQGRSDLENTQRMEQATKEREAMLAAIGVGNETVQNQSALDEAAFNRLSTARGMAEGERSQTQGQANSIELQNLGYDQDVQKMALSNGYDLAKLDKEYGHDITMAAVNQGYDLEKLDATFGHDVTMAGINQGYDLEKMSVSFGNDMTKLVTASNLDTQSKTTLMELQDKIDTKQLLTTQDFTAIQNDLDRQLVVAKQTNDIQGQKDLMNLKGSIDQMAQARQLEFQDYERTATQKWQTGERMSTQDFDKATQYYDWAKKDAEQKNDIDAQKTIEGMREKTQLAMQTNEMGQEEKMTYLKAQLDEAKANNDVGRQETIIGFQTTQEIEKMYKAGEIDQANIKVKATVDEALAQNDWVRATATQNAAFVHDGLERAKDRVIEQARIDLQAKGVNIDALFKGYEAGTVSADSLLNLVKSAGKELGVSVSAPDPMATEKELTKEFKQNQIQYALSHPEFAKKDRDGNVVGLTDTAEAQNGFNEFVNNTLYGENPKLGVGTELANSSTGDNLEIKAGKVVKDVDGKELPAGSYTVKKGAVEHAGKWDVLKQKSQIDTYDESTLVDNNGVEYVISREKTGSSKGGGLTNNVLNPLSYGND